jgi:hypothetical protein
LFVVCWFEAKSESDQCDAFWFDWNCSLLLYFLAQLRCLNNYVASENKCWCNFSETNIIFASLFFLIFCYLWQQDGNDIVSEVPWCSPQSRR